MAIFGMAADGEKSYNIGPARYLTGGMRLNGRLAAVSAAKP